MSNFSEEEIQNKIQQMKDSGHPTMSPWAERLNSSIKMTPETIKANQRLHAQDVLFQEQAVSEIGTYSI